MNFKSEIPRQVGPSTHYLSSTIVYLSIYQKKLLSVSDAPD